MNEDKLVGLARGVEPPGYTELTSALREIAKPFGLNFSFCQRASLYELYTQEYIARLAEYLKAEWGGKRILEVCAGDGRFTRFLRQAGVSMLDATDTKDGKDCDFNPAYIEEHVMKFDAVEAVDHFKPDLVIAAWPPYGSTIPETILELGVPVIYTGEGEGGCCGSEDLWGWTYEELACSIYSLCRTDYDFGGLSRDGIMHHSLTVIFHPKKSERKEVSDESF